MVPIIRSIQTQKDNENRDNSMLSLFLITYIFNKLLTTLLISGTCHIFLILFFERKIYFLSYPPMQMG